MLHLNENGVEVFRSKYKNSYQESFWDNYDLILWSKSPNGFSSSNGLFRKNSWGLVKRFKINNAGMWVLPKKYVKYFK